MIFKDKKSFLGIMVMLLLVIAGCTSSNSTKWNLEFEDACTENWEENWFKDGLISKVEQSRDGMNFIAGSVNRDDAHHTVLWTKKSFKGDVKIEYNYMRTDTQVVNVNILYIQAEGIGVEPYSEDISKWSKLREVPKMSIYYNYMNPLHISYAAFPMVNEDPENDYLRVRKYPITEEITFEDMEVSPSYFKTGMFLSNIPYKITVIKTDSELHFTIKGDGKEREYSWSLKEGQSPNEGRIGLRHMYTRSAQYSNFKVWTRLRVQ